MANNTQDVELRIRATNYSQQTTDKVVSSLKDLTRAQDDQIASAKDSAKAASALESQYSKIEDAVKALVSQTGLVKLFETQSEATERAAVRVDAARVALAEYNATLDPAARKTKEQRDTLDGLTRALKGAEKGYQAIQNRLATTGERLAKLGIDTANVAGAQQTLVNAITEGNAALEKQERAIIELSGAEAASRVEAQKQAEQREKLAAINNRIALSQQAYKLQLDAERQAHIEANQSIADEQRLKIQSLNATIALSRQTAAEADAINKKTAALNAQNAALRQAADQAERTARAAGVTARPAAVTAPRDIAATIRDIGDPAAAALRSTQGLEAAVGALEARVAAINGPVKDYKNALREAAAAQNALVAAASQIAVFNEQVQAVRNARAEYVKSRTAVRELITELRSGAAGDDVTTRLARAQATLERSATGLRDVTAAARQTRDALTAAGVDTANLAQAEATLVQQAQRATGAISTLTEAVRNNGEAANRGQSSLIGWFTAGRDTTSVAQRLKGELIGLAAAYIGVNAAVQLGNDTLDVFSRNQALQSRLLVAAGGDAKAAAEEFRFLEQASKDYSFRLLDVGNAYARFSIAARGSNLTTEETRFIFNNLALSARNARLTTDEFTGVLRAFEQTVNKSKLSTEELNQLAERLPGVFSIAAKALGVTNAELAKQLELGERTFLDVIKIAQGIGDAYGKIGDGTRQLNQAQADFQNATDNFKKAIGEAGFAQAYTEFLDKLTEILGGDRGAQLAAGISEAFTKILDVILLLVENIDSVVLALKLLLGLGLAKWALDAGKAVRLLQVEMLLLSREIYGIAGAGIVKLLTGIGVGAAGAATPVGALSGALGFLRAAIVALTRAVPILLAAWAAFELVTFAWDKFFNEDDAKKAGEKAGKAGAEAAKKSAALVPPPERDASYDELSKNQDKIDTLIRKSEADLLETRKQAAKNNLKERQKFVDQEFDVEREAARKRYKDKTVLEIALAQIQYASDIKQQAEQQRFQNEQTKTDETAATKRKALREKIANELEKIEADNAKRSAELNQSNISDDDYRLARQNAIREALEKQRDELIKANVLGADEAKKAKQKYDLLIDQRVVQEGQLSNRDLANKKEKEFNSLLEIQKSRIKEANDLYETGQIGIEERGNRVNAVIAETAPALQEAGNKALEFANKVRAFLDPTVYQKLVSGVKQALVTTNEDAATTAENIRTQQDLLNAALAQQAAEIQNISTQRKLGLITSEQEAVALNATATKYKDTILDTAEALRQLYKIAFDTGTISKEAYDKAVGSLNNLSLSTKSAVAATSQLSDTVVSSIAQNGVTAFESLAESIANVVTGTQSLGQGFRGAARAAAQFFAQLLRDIGLAIAKQLILNAIATYGGGYGAAAVKLGGVVAGQHNGGVTGTNATFKRRVDMSIFNGAPKYHNGGIAGLKPNEVPTILEKNEEVLTRNDPRHVLNGGASGGSGGAGTRFVLVDDRAKVAEAMQTAEGEKVIVETLRRNIPTIKQYLK